MDKDERDIEAKIKALESEKRIRQARLDRRTEEVEQLKIKKQMLEDLVRLKQDLVRQRALHHRSQG